MSSIITTPHVLESLREADAAITVASVAVQASEAELAGLTMRRDQLAESLAAHITARPEPDPAVTSMLSDILAADPSTATAPDWIERVGNLQASTVTALASWEATRAILTRTEAKLADEASVVADRLQIERETHEAAYAVFLHQAREAILNEFEVRWHGLIAELLAPLAAVSKTRKLYGGGFHQLGLFHAIDPESKLTILFRDPSSPIGTGRRRLFPIEAQHGGEDSIASFRARLAAPVAAPRSIKRAS